MTIAEKLTQIAENEQKVYEAGYAKGQAEGGGGTYDEGFEAGKKSEYDTFWDSCQDNGSRTDYRYGFAGYSWTEETFRPKYDIAPSAYNAIYLFTRSRITNMKQALADRGVVLDVSQVVNALSMFEEMPNLTHLPALDLRACTSASNLFREDKALVSIDELKVGANTAFNNLSFSGCAALETVIFGGVIGKSGLDLSACTKLSRDSITSVVNALSPTASGQTVTLSKRAVEAIPTFDVCVPLHPFTDTTKTENGMTYTDNGDGSITMDGTARRNSYFYVTEMDTLLFPAGTYALSLPCVGTNDGTTFTVEAYDAHTYERQVFDIGANQSTTVTFESEQYIVSTLSSAGGVAYNSTVTPTIKRVCTWDELVATKPNWTITLA